MNIILLTRGHRTLPDLPCVRQIQLQTSESKSHARAVHLLVLDARRMSAACLEAGLIEVSTINSTLGFRVGVLLCSTPTLDLTVKTMRAGLHDIIRDTLNARSLCKLVQNALPGSRLGHEALVTVFSLLRLSGGKQAFVPRLPVVELARRENELSSRAEQLANIEKRLAFDRAALEARDQELRTSTRRLERNLARQQSDTDVAAPATPSASHVAAAELQAHAARLEQRSRDLDFREKLLREMEALLTASAQAVR
jgi:hypothetical protein